MTEPLSKPPDVDSPRTPLWGSPHGGSPHRGSPHRGSPHWGTSRWIAPSQLQTLIDILRSENYRVLGPTLDQHAIVYDEITSIGQLPKGYCDSQAPAVYQLTQTPSAPENQKLFHFNLGPHSPKQFLFPPTSVLPGPEKTGPDPTAAGAREAQLVQPMAILGLRACELAAIAIQDRVLMSPPFVDSQYALRRKSLFVIAVQCTTAASTCFCPSMNTGPELPGPEHPGPNANPNPYDLALTELVPSSHSQFTHGFLIQAGSRRGQVILDQLPSEEPSREILDAKKQTIEDVHKKIQRAMPSAPSIPGPSISGSSVSGPSSIDGQSGDLRDALLARLNHPHWQNVADRCLSCANCTMVCPTCFCSSVDEVSDLLSESSIRQRRWDSCFNPDFSHTSGAPVRNTVRSRYRQWLTHKLATWFDQFDSSGCVGCGRCITWCPVGIDLTQEVAKLLEPSDAPLLNVPPRLHHR